MQTDKFLSLGEGIDRPLPPECVYIAGQMFAAEIAYRKSAVKTPVVIGETPEATAMIKSLRATTDEVTKRLYESDLVSIARHFCVACTSMSLP